MSHKIIHLVDDESIIHDIFNRVFKDGYQLIVSENMAQAKANHTPDVDVVIMDLMIPGTSGIEIFKEIKKIDPDVRVIFLTAFGTIESAIEAIKLGAEDYLQKPFNNLELRHKIERVIKEKRLKSENIQLKKTLNQRFSFENIIGRSKSLLKVLDTVKCVAQANSNILITGESGTGKELIAKAIYQSSPRLDQPFFTFNSSNFPPTLFESMLFGYKKGAFTGAYSDKQGILEEADQGIIFFDEIANLTAETQAKILRFIQEKVFQPLGTSKEIKVDVQFIAATNVNLKEKVDRHEFREDLYYRLNIINIHLPPLRERKEDIPLLVNHFVQKYSLENKKQITDVTEQFLQPLLDYSWPGNIRELENTVLRAVVLAAGDRLTRDSLPDEIKNGMPKINQKGSFNDLVDGFKRRLVQEALQRHNGVQKNAAEDLGLKPTTLSELMKRLNIEK